MLALKYQPVSNILFYKTKNNKPQLADLACTARREVVQGIILVINN